MLPKTDRWVSEMKEISKLGNADQIEIYKGIAISRIRGQMVGNVDVSNDFIDIAKREEKSSDLSILNLLTVLLWLKLYAG